MQSMFCLRCRRGIEPGDKSVAVYMFAQTVGVRPRQKSAANRISFCPQCAVSLAMGMPPEGALNMAAWEMIRELVSEEPSLNEAAWENLRGCIGLLGTGKEDSGAVPARGVKPRAFRNRSMALIAAQSQASEFWRAAYRLDVSQRGRARSLP